MKNGILIFVIIFSLLHLLSAQNLIANPGFEALISDYEKEYPKSDPSIVPNSRGCISCLQSWRINYVNTAFGLTEKLPEWNWKYYSNIWLYGNPFEKGFWYGRKIFGKSYAIITVNGFDPEGKNRPLNPKSDYMQTKMLRPLTQGKKYNVSFQVHLGDYLTLNNLGILLTTYPIRLDTISFINLTAQIVMESIDTSRDLTLFQQSFVADSNYKYLTIGYFPKNKVIRTLYRPHNMYNDYKNIDLTEINKRPSFFFVIDDIKITEELEREMMQKIIFNKIDIKNIQFEINKSNLTLVGKMEIDKLVKLLDEIPYLKIKIEGNTDDEGSDEFNMDLSNNRSKEILNYLVNKGIQPDRLATEGFGETKPLVPNSSEENRALNRRVEIKVLK